MFIECTEPSYVILALFSSSVLPTTATAHVLADGHHLAGGEQCGRGQQLP